MRAVLMQGGRLWVDDVADPVPQAGEVLVKSLACGICGSDLHAVQHTEAFIRTSREAGGAFKLTTGAPVVLGHEFCAEVVDHGPGTERLLRPGTRVCSVPALPRAGGARAVGYSAEAPGGFGQLMVLSERLLRRVPDGVSTAHAALTEPMAVGYHAVAKARLEGGEAALVVGCGPVGLAVVAALKLAGVGPVVAADFSPGRRRLAEALGADALVDPAERSPYETWVELASTRPVEPGVLLAERSRSSLKPAVFFECVGVPGIVEQMILGAPRECRIVVVGVCLETDHYRPLVAINKEIAIQHVLAYSVGEFDQTLRHIADGTLDVRPLVTGRVGLDGVAGAFADLARPEADGKVLVEPW